jgi:hypothetical protein
MTGWAAGAVARLRACLPLEGKTGAGYRFKMQRFHLTLGDRHPLRACTLR